MAQLWKVRLPNGQVLVPGDWTSAEPLFSTVELGAGAFPVLSAYTYGIGGEVPGSVGARTSNDADTNLQGEGARLPEDEELVCYTMAVEVFQIGPSQNADSIPQTDPPEVSLMNMLRLQRDMMVITRIAYVKEYTRAPMSWFPASSGVMQYNSGARSQASSGTAGYVASNNGGTGVESVRHFASPLYIAGGESLAVDFKPGPGAVTGLDLATDSRMRMRVYMDGYRKRPVA